MEALNIATKWDNANTNYSAAAGEIPSYFKIFGTKPADKAELDVVKYQRQLKHVMLDALLWNSLAPKFQPEMLT
eukprot:6485310-Ditylum_brightwellii.AAC.1